MSPMRTLPRALMVVVAMSAAAQPAFAADAPRPAAPAASRQAPASATLNPGDVIQIVLPGEEGFSRPFSIDREGRVDLPEAGQVELGGLTLGQAKERVRTALSGYIRDLARFNLVVRERKLLVNVMGYVRNPGQFELPATANVQQALAAAGGLVPGAQLDRMQVRRGGGDPITFDYKSYLDGGSARSLPALRPLDEIFVPSSPMTGNVAGEYDPRQQNGDASEARTSVRVFGEVNHPGSFAFRDGMTIMDALMRSGGVTRYSGSEQIRVITAEGTPSIFNLKGFLDSGNQALNRPLAAGTTIFVPAQVEEVRSGPRVVYVMGEVAHPGAMEMREGASFFDVLASTGGPTRFADTKQVRIIRASGQVDVFDLASFTNGSGGAVPTIRGGDAVFMPEKQSAEGDSNGSWLRTPPDRAVRVMGAVRNPGRLQWSDEMSILDLLAQVNGATERADLGRVQIRGADGQKIDFDLQTFLSRGGRVSSLPRIRGGATIVVPETPQSPNDMRSTWTRQPADQSIYVMGSVGKPGRYAFDASLGFLDILTAADGPTPVADILNVRITHRGEGRDRVTKVNLAAYFETGDESLLPRVRPGDVIFMPDRNRNWLEQSSQSTVRVLGAVGKPGRYQFTNGMTLLDLLAEAGGPSGNALQSKIVVVNLTAGGPSEARTFDLPRFARSGDFSSLPLVRAGDTIYVPDQGQSDWRQFFDGLRDTLSIVSVIALIAAF